MFHIVAFVASLLFVFFFNDTATTEIYTLSLHDALPIWGHFRAGDSLQYYTGFYLIRPLKFITLTLKLNNIHTVILAMVVDGIPPNKDEKSRIYTERKKKQSFSLN